MKFSAISIAVPKIGRHPVSKFLMIMKLTTLMLIIGLLQVSAKGFSQITLNAKKASIVKVFQSIQKQSGFDLFYDENDLKDTRVTIKTNNSNLEETLKKCLANLDLDYRILDKNVVITQKVKPITNAKANQITPIDANGHVVDKDGIPIPGATVRVQNGSQATISDEKGFFTLKGVENGSIIMVTVIGYEPKAVNAAANVGDVRLVQATSKLDEVQVQAYGVTSRRLSTGNISTVKAADIEKQPVSNPLLALAGRVPGLTITQNTGVPGSSVSVRIQGQNSMTRGNEPFYVIDGVPYISQLPSNLGDGILGAQGTNGTDFYGGGSPFSFINPEEIESIDVLKDADATAIYGSRAANGAILITTKKGKAGLTKVDLKMQQGVGKVTRFLKVLNTDQYLQLRREAYQNDGLPVPTKATTPSTSNYDLTLYDSNRNTDWQKELIGGTAKYTDAQLSISGGNVQTSFRISGNYHNETTVFPGDFGDQKGSFGFNLNHNSMNQKFKIQISGNYLSDNNRLLSNDLTNIAIRLSPNAPSLTKPDGSLNWARFLPAGAVDSVSTWLNPLAQLDKTYKNNTKNLISSGNVSYEFYPGLVLKANLGYTNLTTDEITTSPLSAVAPERRIIATATSLRNASYGQGAISSWIIEPQFSYNNVWGANSINALLGATFQKLNTQEFAQIGVNYISDALLKSVSAANTRTIINDINTTYKYNAFFARLNYNYDSRYILNGTLRRDGSSRFGPDSRFHDFWAIGGAWVFSSEDFIKEKFPFISFGKLRGSYGLTGNDQIGDYVFSSQYSSIVVNTPYQGTGSIQITGNSNPQLQWEETKKKQFGIDLGFLKDRILFNINYFDNHSSNQLINYSLPAFTGFGSVLANLPAVVQNRGWELSATTVNIKTENVNWSSGINFTTSQNKLLEFPNLETSAYYSSYIIGQPVSIGKTYASSGVNPQTGLYQVNTASGTPTSNPSDIDRTYIYNLMPKFYGGIQNSISYKSLQLDFLLQFVKQQGSNDIPYYAQPGAFASGNRFAPTANLSAIYLQRWTKPGQTDALVQKVSTTLYSDYFGSLGISDASYIRLKNLSFSWSLPSQWQNRMKMTNAKLFIQGQNLFTLTNYIGPDPENQSVSSLAPLRVITLGFQTTF
ncbi:TonB-linked outer membrane protein, SusC/RagA family [Mucilaginibacter pineti]|uniref:TonB-linked outer membrane protein, SusC/RagA family n=1 Tax=Mucilaginibacter pineti TaxID=1391627 RepID=A0A1G7IRM1_9SPHI|nr:SusC/RagA family TonB-linked outer membrane protein [Mucilaginibacter pineti]SDF15238.1 TonB-linked outer membrane protein, SusC/RagA family [Mucilaginibacter pineti]